MRKLLLPLVVVPVVFAPVWVGAALLAPKWVPGTDAYEVRRQVTKLREAFGPDVEITCCTSGSVSCGLAHGSKK